MLPAQRNSPLASIEILESAGLVCVWVDQIEVEQHGNVMLSPEEADTMAEELRRAAQAVREA